MAIHDLKGQIGRLPEQPGVYLFLGAAGETLYVGKARVLRDRVRSYLGAEGHEPAHRRAAARRRGARRHRHRLGRRGAGAREPPDQAAQPALQRPAARRQDLSVPAADDDRARAAAARGAPGRARRQRLRRAVHAGRASRGARWRWRTGCSGSDRATRSSTASATGRASSTTSSAAWRRASTRSARSSGTGSAVEQAQLLIEGRQDELVEQPARTRWPTPRPTRALRARRASARRDPDRSRRCAIGATRWRRRRSAIATRSA